ncbi:putative G3BP-like protein [Sesbania bispinosa]|nr:putative G3BP-like protein [Sesbania bispinosa]
MTEVGFESSGGCGLGRRKRQWGRGSGHLLQIFGHSSKGHGIFCFEGNVEPHFQSDGNDDSQVTELASSTQHHATNQSYASIVSIAIDLSLPSTVLIQGLKLITFVVGESPKGSLGSAKDYVPTNTVKTGPDKTESLVVESVESAVVPEAVPESVGTWQP